MMILTDLYIALALLLIAGAGLMIVWQLTLKPGDKGLLKIAAVLLALAMVIAAGAMAYYGKHMMSHGECPYSQPLVSCPLAPPAH
jgi:hypothetical protein